MAEASDPQGILRQNLADAGCGPEIIQQCMTLAREKERAKLMHLLTSHRRALLDAVHQNERRIDCLDYLLYTLEKQHK